MIPLTGKPQIAGNIRLILDWELKRIEVHFTAKVDIAQPLTGATTGLDAGLTEVFTDEQGLKYGVAFGKILKEQSDRLFDKSKKRNKLRLNMG